ncbi:MAG: glycosyltransferase family 9 protein [Chitinophagaceae bacterium]
MAKILVIQTAFLGDAVLATAVLETIHRESPDAQISLLVRKGNEGLFAGHPFLHEMLVWDKQRHKYRNWLQLLFRIRKARYDRVITLQRFASTGLWTAASGATFRAGFSKNPLSVFFTHRVEHELSAASASLHEVERNHQLLTAFVKGHPHLPKLYPSEADSVRGRPRASLSGGTAAARRGAWSPRRRRSRRPTRRPSFP